MSLLNRKRTVLKWFFIFNIILLSVIGLIYLKKNQIKFSYFFSNPKLEKLDKVYLLNLDRSPERYERMKELLDRLEIPFERFEAIDGKRIKLIGDDTEILGAKLTSNTKPLTGNFLVECKEDKKYNFYLAMNNVTSFPMRMPGELGCACSHITIWHEALKFKNVLILEDDIKFKKFFKEKLDDILETAPNDYDIIFLNANYQKDSLEDIKGTIFKKVLKNVTSLEAYIVTDKGANILLNGYGAKEYKEPIDVYISNMIGAGKLKAYMPKKRITIQATLDMIPSTINVE